jgi:exopolysaccharide biosynthesis WecB/TagA/CpsF family protein
MIRHESFLSANFVVTDTKNAADYIVRRLDGVGLRNIIHGNAHTLRVASEQAELRGILARKDTIVLFEGIALKFLRYLLRGEWWPDVNGTDLVPLVLSHAGDKPLKVALVGGRPGVAERAAASLRKSSQNLQIVLAQDGYTWADDETALVAALRSAAPDVVFVGMGTPLQEQKAAQWGAALKGTIFWTVGGLFDFHAGSVARAPRLVRSVRCEWAWRILQEPSRLFERYLGDLLWLIRMSRRGADVSAKHSERREKAMVRR